MLFKIYQNKIMAKYYPRIDESQSSSLIDIACALFTGELNVNTQLASRVFASETSTMKGVTTILELVSNIIPTNGNPSRLLVAKDDDDVQTFIPTSGKAVRGHLFVAIRIDESASAPLGFNNTVATAIDEKLNDIRKICDKANAVYVGKQGPDTITNTTNYTGFVFDADTAFVIAWGYLKETQTEDYNPLTVINSAWEYAMFNPASFQ